MKKYTALLVILCAALLNGCLQRSLGDTVRSDTTEIQDNYFEHGAVNNDNMIENTLDTKLVQIPMVTSVNASLVYSDSAVISWETDIESDGYVEYGYSEHYSMSSYVSTKMSKIHSVQLQSLRPGTRYCFRIISSRHSLEASKSISSGHSFITEGKKEVSF